jgi:hypothetical protein
MYNRNWHQQSAISKPLPTSQTTCKNNIPTPTVFCPFPIIAASVRTDRRASSVTPPPALRTTGGPSSPRFQKSVGLHRGSMQEMIKAAFMFGNWAKDMDGLWDCAKALQWYRYVRFRLRGVIMLGTHSLAWAMVRMMSTDIFAQRLCQFVGRFARSC